MKILACLVCFLCTLIKVFFLDYFEKILNLISTNVVQNKMKKYYLCNLQFSILSSFFFKDFYDEKITIYGT